MIMLLEAAIKISVVIGLGLVAALLFRRRSAALRHWLLATAVAAAMTTPIVMQVAPSWNLPVAGPLEGDQAHKRPATSQRQVRVGITTVASSPSTTAPATSSFDPTTLLLTLWITGVVVNLGALTVGFLRLRRTAARAAVVRHGPWADAAHLLSEHFHLRTPVRLLQSDQPALLVTWGLITPKVLLPIDAASWDADRIRVVLAHELAHVQRHDWIVQVASELLRSVNWFNPVVWLAASRLRLESERACDDAVVNLGVSGRDYAQHLLELARQFGRARNIAYPAVAIVPRRSSLERRVTAMLNAGLSRGPITRAVRLLTLAALFAVALPIALFAQNTFATISGTIVDPSNGVLPGVNVVAIDTDRRVSHEVRSDRTGHFELIGLPQGNYALEAELPGFETFREKLTLTGQDMTREITLNVGTLQETIAVSNSGPSDGPGSPSPDYRAGRLPPTCGSDAGARQPVAPPPPGAVRIGGQIRTPRKLYHVSPIYPAGTTTASTVRLEAVIGVDGLVKDVKLVNDAPPEFVRSAIDAVRQWEFDPTLLNCEAVEVRMSVLVDYR
jgi:beta-lactamase regulating signal transducer with metallopeptidase domain